MKILEQLQIKLPQFNWSTDNDTFFGSLTVPKITKRINKDLHELSNVNIFISSEMGGTKNSPEQFRYAMCYQQSNVRKYKHKKFETHEVNKIFVSGANIQETVNKLINEIDMNKYILK